VNQTVVLDASVVLASIFGEPGAIELADVFAGAAISAVNFAEVISKCVERHAPSAQLAVITEQFGRICRPLTPAQAVQAGLWRAETRGRGLSLGDRCCLALAKELGATVMTADRAWEGLDLGVAVRLVR
jgi:PIN domain nuclease of toxin-antitoxin system